MSDYNWWNPLPLRNDPIDPEPAEPERPAKPNPRRRLQPSAKGHTALGAYRERVAAAQGGDGGREALEAAQGAWASERSLEPRDALLLDELARQPQTILELTRSLDDCGMKRPEIQEGIDRLEAAELVEALPQPARSRR